MTSEGTWNSPVKGGNISEGFLTVEDVRQKITGR